MARPKLQTAPAPEQPEQPEPKKKKRWPLMAAVLLLLGGGGGGAAWYALQDSPAQAAEAPKPKTPIFITLEAFTVNLQPGGEAQYLQTQLVLKTVEPAAETAIKTHMPEVRDRILRVLSAKRGEELLTGEGKQRLAGEIAEHVNRPFDGDAPNQVDGVLFTSFVIQ